MAAGGGAAGAAENGEGGSGGEPLGENLWCGEGDGVETLRRRLGDVVVAECECKPQGLRTLALVDVGRHG